VWWGWRERASPQGKKKKGGSKSCSNQAPYIRLHPSLSANQILEYADAPTLIQTLPVPALVNDGLLGGSPFEGR